MKFTRRQFIGAGLVAGIGGAAGARYALPQSAPRIPGSIVGANAKLGHLLREGNFAEPSSETKKDIVIVGGGIAGLSAAWKLQKLGLDDFTLLELEQQAGGNALSGENAVSAYPWGAHYVPLLTRHAESARALFEELGIIAGYDDKGLPIYNEYYLCCDPHERLFLYGRWQEDLLPSYSISDADRADYQSFFAAMDAFKKAHGSDGKKAFTIPVDFSSADSSYRALDTISMADYMKQNGWNSKPLHWYINYCCRDDYGTPYTDVSAWAGIHYFAARDGVAANADAQTVITWPEGNGWIAKQLREKLAAHLQCQALVYRVTQTGKQVAVDYFDPATALTHRILAKAAILATPRFVADRLLGSAPDDAHSYAPWMVANVTVDRLPQGTGMALCWDNVIYDSPSLGYVVATHQHLDRVQRETVLTYYWPLDGQPPAASRQAAYARSYDEWQAMILEELLRIHPELQGGIKQIDVWLWGHGMIRPTPGYIWGTARQAACMPQPPIFHAHSDMSGISIFEEANYRGVSAADAVKDYLHA